RVDEELSVEPAQAGSPAADRARHIVGGRRRCHPEKSKRFPGLDMQRLFSGRTNPDGVLDHRGLRKPRAIYPLRVTGWAFITSGPAPGLGHLRSRTTAGQLMVFSMPPST